MLHIGLALALAASPAWPAPARTCGLRRLELCDNTNYLVDRPDFLHALRRFVGRGRFYDDPRASKYDAAVEALHGPPDPRVQAAPGLLRFGACVSHFCPDKGAVFITSAGEVQALALLNVDPPAQGDRDEDRLTLELTVAPERRAMIEPLARAWAQEQIAAENAAYRPDHPSRLAAVRIEPPAGGRLTPPQPPATPRHN